MVFHMANYMEKFSMWQTKFFSRHGGGLSLAHHGAAGSVPVGDAVTALLSKYTANVPSQCPPS